MDRSNGVDPFDARRWAAVTVRPRDESKRACLEVCAVTYDVGTRRLLDGVSLGVEPGCILAVVGPNGAGKSTLLKIVAGDLSPSDGQVLLDGRPLSAYSTADLALRRAVLPQQTLLQFAFTAREVVRMGRSPHLRRRRETAADEAVIDHCLERTETASLASRSFPSLSGGEQGRVSLARVLAQEAPILLLDEPTAALDVRHQQVVLSAARELAGAGAAVLTILHDLNLAANYADRIAVLHAGRLVADGPPRAVLREQLLSAVFACPIAVTTHPVRGTPLVLPLPCDRSSIGHDDPWSETQPSAERARSTPGSDGSSGVVTESPVGNGMAV